MKGFAMLGIGRVGWIEKDKPVCGPLDALVEPIAVSPCTSDIHTVWEGAIGDRHDMILGHEAVGRVVEVGSLVKDFKPGDRVIVPAITPDWASLQAQGGYSMHSGGMLAGWKFSNLFRKVSLLAFRIRALSMRWFIRWSEVSVRVWDIAESTTSKNFALLRNLSVSPTRG